MVFTKSGGGVLGEFLTTPCSPGCSVGLVGLVSHGIQEERNLNIRRIFNLFIYFPTSLNQTY